MVEATQQKPYLKALAEVAEENIKNNLRLLYEAGYVDFYENKIMIESNPGMSIDDIIACIDESKKEEFLAEQLIDLESSYAAAEELDEKDLKAMNDILGPLLDSPDSEQSPPQDRNSSEEKQISSEEVSGDAVSGGKSSDSPGAELNKKNTKPSGEEVKKAMPVQNEQTAKVTDPVHDDPNLYAVRKRKPKRSREEQKPEKATEIQKRVGQQENATGTAA